MVVIRRERPADADGVRRVNEEAFGRQGEADLVEALHRQGDVTLSLVAEVNEKIVGHILFSPVRVVSEEGEWSAVALGPMGVLPPYQRDGIGSQLVRAGLAGCQQAGEGVVFVLGHPDYYPRFGFEPSRSHGIRSEFDVPAEVFMVVELEEAALAGRDGVVHYSPVFAEVT